MVNKTPSPWQILALTHDLVIAGGVEGEITMCSLQIWQVTVAQGEGGFAHYVDTRPNRHYNVPIYPPPVSMSKTQDPGEWDWTPHKTHVPVQMEERFIYDIDSMVGAIVVIGFCRERRLWLSNRHLIKTTGRKQTEELLSSLTTDGQGIEPYG